MENPTNVVDLLLKYPFLLNKHRANCQGRDHKRWVQHIIKFELADGRGTKVPLQFIKHNPTLFEPLKVIRLLEGFEEW